MKKKNQITRGRKSDFAERAPSQLGRTIWEDVIGGDNLELPSTGFMGKVKQAVTKNDYQQLMKEILDSLQEKRTSSAKVLIPHSKKQGVSCTP